MNPERFGIKEAHWEIVSQLVLRPIWAAGGKVWLFGSRARGCQRPFSDIDLLLEGAIDPALLSSISENLEESTLPFRVDLVREQDLADAYRAGVYKDRIALE